MIQQLFLLAAAYTLVVSIEVVISSTPKLFYDRAPRIPVTVSGLNDAEGNAILLEIGSPGNSLQVLKNYLISKSDDGLVLKLIANTSG